MSRYSSRQAPSPPGITLYDTPGHTPQPWAPNIWRIRFILNYKRLRYRTVWVEFPDVEATLRSIGAPPSARRSDGRSLYTLPVIVDPTRNPHAPEILSNTNHIAEYLEAAYPARPVFPEGSRAVQTLFVHYIQEVFAKPLLPIMVPISHQQLPERSQSHFRAGYPAPAMPPPQFLSGPQREQAWMAVKEQFDFLAMILDKNTGDGDGTVAMGRDVSYADFALCSVLIWIERMAPHDGWARVRTWNNGRWVRLWERCKDYMDEF
ncbi:Glutathione S-transferase-like protein ustS [Hypsizygus marmoreus]|uniref:Glutathione S-transferase-like protein ustS n=1 Tax=Hypsizygus marmoreus TaxID=39966 RepID=A0A369J366_HYPMA|nr:Glutathione S-transferase-like protein ustS [Hypsizygus marmoreus]